MDDLSGSDKDSCAARAAAAVSCALWASPSIPSFRHAAQLCEFGRECLCHQATGSAVLAYTVRNTVVARCL